MTQPFDPAPARYINLATYRKNGKEVKTPVWVAAVADTLYVFSEARAGKVKRISNNGKMSIAACDASGKVSSGWIKGTARIVTDAAEIESMYAAFDKKYGWQSRLINFVSKLSGRYNKRAIIALAVDADEDPST